MISLGTVLGGVFWRFDGEPFATEAEFNAAIREYQSDGWNRHDWDPQAPVIDPSRIQLRYECWRKRRQVQKLIELETADGGPFRAGELLFQIHNAVVADLRGIDHRYFEGLKLTGEAHDGTPPYRLVTGS